MLSREDQGAGRAIAEGVRARTEMYSAAKTVSADLLRVSKRQRQQKQVDAGDWTDYEKGAPNKNATMAKKGVAARGTVAALIRGCTRST